MFLQNTNLVQKTKQAKRDFICLVAPPITDNSIGVQLLRSCVLRGWLSGKHYWNRDKECYVCKARGKHQSLRVNTVMYGSQLPFSYWFIAIYLLTLIKKSFSTIKLQCQHG